jgi:hypothetical protein
MIRTGIAARVRPAGKTLRNVRLILPQHIDAKHTRPLSPVAHEFAGHCRAFFGVSHAHPST